MRKTRGCVGVWPGVIFQGSERGVLWVMCSQGRLRVGLAMSIAFGSWRKQGKF